MVLLTLAELSIQITWWTLKGAYNVGKYLIYGPQKTEQEKMREQINELKSQIDMLKNRDGDDKEENDGVKE